MLEPKFEITSSRDELIISYHQGRKVIDFSYQVYDGRHQVHLDRLKDNVRKNYKNTMTIDKVYTLGRKYNITPVIKSQRIIF